MKRTQIKRPVVRKSRDKSEEQSPNLLPLTAREFLKLPAVLGGKPSGRPDKSGGHDGHR